MAALVMRLLPVISILIDFFVMIYLIFLIYCVIESTLSVLKQLRAGSIGFAEFYVKVLIQIIGFKRMY